MAAQGAAVQPERVLALRAYLDEPVRELAQAQRLQQRPRRLRHGQLVLAAIVVHAARQARRLRQQLYHLPHVGYAAMHMLRAGDLAAGLHGPERIDEEVAPVFVAVQRHVVHPFRPQQHALRPDFERARLRLQLVPRIDVGRLGQAQLLAVRAVLRAAGVDLVRAERHQLSPGSARRPRHRHGQLHVGPARALRVALAVADVGYRRRVDYRCGRQLLHIGRDVLRVALAQQSGRAGDRIGYHLHRPRADEAARAGNKYGSCIHIFRSSETYSACV